MTRVVNIHSLFDGWHGDPDYVYIGRGGRGMEGEFGNPHLVGYCHLCRHKHQRGEAVVAYKDYFERRIATDPAFKAKILALSGKTLVCFCKPNACHGDVIAEYLNKL